MSDFATFPEPRTVRLERLLPGPIERVWAYIYEPEKRAQWFAGGSIEPKVGGKAELIFNHPNITSEPTPENHKEHCEDVTAHETVTHYDPPHLLGYTFCGGKSKVTFELTPKGDQVLLVITETHIPNRNDVVLNAGGWHAHADLLVGVLTGASARPFWSKIKVFDVEYAKRAPE